MLSIDYLHPTTLTVRASLFRTEAKSFAAALTSQAPDSIVFVSFVDCLYVDLAALSALVSYDASRAAPLVVIVRETGYVRAQFQLSGLDSRLGVVANLEQAYERAWRLHVLANIEQSARRGSLPGARSGETPPAAHLSSSQRI